MPRAKLIPQTYDSCDRQTPHPITNAERERGGCLSCDTSATLFKSRMIHQPRPSQCDGTEKRVPWYHGTMVPWHHGAMVPWYHDGTMVAW